MTIENLFKDKLFQRIFFVKMELKSEKNVKTREHTAINIDCVFSVFQKNLVVTGTKAKLLGLAACFYQLI